MMLVNGEFDLEIALEENIVNVLVIENPDTFTKLSGDFWKQISSKEGSWILSDGKKEIKIDKNVECIYNPFSIDCNSRKILSTLYKNLNLVGLEELLEETGDLNYRIVTYLEKLMKEEWCDFSYSLELDITGLLKLYDIKVVGETETLADNVTSYINLMHRTCGIQVFVFMNMKQYFPDNSLKEIYKQCIYEKIHLILFECIDQPVMEYEKKTIIDRDNCIITNGINSTCKALSSVTTTFEV